MQTLAHLPPACLRAFLTCICLAAITGCAVVHTPREFIEGLKPVTTPSKLTVARDVTYKRVVPVTQFVNEEGLTAGTYVAELENEHGVFYRGPGYSVSLLHGGKPLFGGNQVGGVWVPKKAGVRWRLYYYFNSGKAPVSGGGGATGIITALNNNSIEMLPEIDDAAFLATLNIVESR